MEAPKPESNGNEPANLVEVIIDDSPGDTTIRPAGPEIPREWPRPQLPKNPPPAPPEKP